MFNIFLIIVYSFHVGQQDDARMCLNIALTATRHGATVANHVSVTKLHKDSNGKLNGAALKDEMTGKEWDVKAKCIINATGPFTDSIRKMDDPKVKEICCPSSGTHIVLPGYYRCVLSFNVENVINLEQSMYR